MEQPLGALAGLDRQVGPRGRADEQRVAGEQRAAGEEAAVLGPVARACAAQRTRTEPTAISSPSASGVVRVRGARRRRASRPECRARARAARGPRRGRRGCGSRARATIRTPCRSASSRYGSIAYAGSTSDGLARLLVTDEVGGAAEIVVDELAKQHRGDASSGFAVFPIVTPDFGLDSPSAERGRDRHGCAERSVRRLQDHARWRRREEVGAPSQGGSREEAVRRAAVVPLARARVG